MSSKTRRSCAHATRTCSRTLTSSSMWAESTIQVRPHHSLNRSRPVMQRKATTKRFVASSSGFHLQRRNTRQPVIHQRAPHRLHCRSDQCVSIVTHAGIPSGYCRGTAVRPPPAGLRRGLRPRCASRSYDYRAIEQHGIPLHYLPWGPPLYSNFLALLAATKETQTGEHPLKSAPLLRNVQHPGSLGVAATYAPSQ